MQIACHINKTLVDAVNVDIILAHIFPIDLVDLRRDAYVLCHTWWGSDIFYLCVMRCFILPDFLFGFEEPRPSGYADCFE